MHDCMFTGHCMKAVCDQSCADRITANYLLEQNEISLKDKVFNTNTVLLQKYFDMLKKCK